MYEACLGWPQMIRSPHLPARRLKGYVEALTRFSHICYSKGLNNTLLAQGRDLEYGSYCGNSRKNVYSEDRRGDKELLTVYLQLKSIGDHVFLMTSSNNQEPK